MVTLPDNATLAGCNRNNTLAAALKINMNLYKTTYSVNLAVR